MTVTLELSPKIAERLEAAKAQGVDMNLLIERALSQLHSRTAQGFGKFAYLKEKGGLDAFLKERHEDTEREHQNEARELAEFEERKKRKEEENQE